MREGIHDEQDSVPTWDPNSGVPPPMTPEYGYIDQSIPPPLPVWESPPPLSQEWDPNGTIPPPLPVWSAPPPLAQEHDPNASVAPELAVYEIFPPLLSPTAEYAEVIEQSNEIVPSDNTAQQGEVFEEGEVPHIPVLDRELIKLGVSGPEKMEEFLDEKMALPPDAMIDLYHGLNGGLNKALAVLESPDQGVRQISGPCLAVFPVGQFWKPGDAGLKYAIPRGDIQFPGESNPDAKFRIDKGGVVTLVGGLEALPMDQYNGEVLRTERKVDIIEERLEGDVVVGERVVDMTDEEKADEAKIAEKLKELTETRLTKADEARQMAALRASINATLAD